MSETEAAQLTPNAQRLREAITRDYGALCGNVAAMVKRREGPMRFDQRRERIEEIVGEAVTRALERSETFDPGQTAVAWLTGFAVNVLREQQPGRRRRPASQSDVGEEAWAEAVARAFVPGHAEEDPLVSRVRDALGRLTADQQRVLQLGLVQGLDSAALARELGVSTAGAARVRLCRALDALRQWFKQLDCAGPKEQMP